MNAYIVSNETNDNLVGYIQTAVHVSNSVFPSGENTPTPQPEIVVDATNADELLNSHLWNFPATTGSVALGKYPFDPKTPEKVNLRITDTTVTLTINPQSQKPTKITFTPTCGQGLFYGMATPSNIYYIISFQKQFNATANAG